MNIKKLLIILLLSLLSLIQKSYSNEIHGLTIQEPNSSEGISQIEIEDIVQDDLGYIWFGTKDGLNRYDGYEYKIFRPSSRYSDQLAFHKINELIVTSKKDLLIGTAYGLQVLDYKTDKFSNIATFDAKSKLISDNIITVLAEDSLGRLWAGSSRAGATILDKNLKPLFQISSENSVLKSNYIRSLAKSTLGNFWIGTRQGLYFYSNSKESTTSILSMYESTKPIEDVYITALLEIRNHLWIGTTNGLFRLDLRSGEMENIKIIKGKNDSDSFAHIMSLELGTSEKNIFVATAYNGVSLVNTNSKEVRTFLEGKGYAGQLNSNGVELIYKDRTGDFWLATPEGVNKIIADNMRFGHIASSEECRFGDDIFAVQMESKDVVWVASSTVGLTRVDITNHICTNYQEAKIEESTKSLKTITSLKLDSYGFLWIGTKKQGLLYFDLESGQFHSMKSINLDARINQITDNEETLLISTSYQGLLSIDKLTRKISSLETTPKNSGVRSAVYLNNGDILYAGISRGIRLVSKMDSNTTFLSENIKGIPNLVSAMSEDTSRNIWIASRGSGALKIDLQNSNAQHFTLENSNISSNMLWHVEIDNEGKVWFSGSKGLTVYNPKTEKFENYTKKDGLQDDPFTPTGDYDPETDMMLTGGINGFNYFSPSDIKQQTRKIKVAITDFEVNYEKSDLYRNPTERAKENDTDLFLNHDQNIFSFKFSGLDYSDPARIQFAYKLEGYRDDWNYVDASRRFAPYTNLSPGNYTFKVKASNKDGVWSDLETHVKIVITPPWWQTKIAYFSYVFSLLLLIYLFVGYRTKALKQRAIVLDKQVNDRTAELKTEKQKVEQLLSEKNEEFANISHEFRTPLTLILGPAAQLLKSEKSDIDLNRLNIIQRNGFRLLRMVDQLLNLETFRVKGLTQKSPQAIGKTIRLIAEAFADLATEKGIDLDITRIDDICFSFTPDAIEKITINLVSNAIKYTQSGGSISINANRVGDNSYEITVEDSGVGIAKDKQTDVFKRFHRVMDHNSEKVTGAGIGLALVKRLVETHNGEIKLASELGVGTKITVVLPIVDEVEHSNLQPHLNDEAMAMELMNLAGRTDEESKSTETINEHSDRPTILLIEDNADMLEYIRQNLSADYNCLTATNGKEGITVAKEQIPDIIISDVMMPEMDGFEATHHLRQMDETSHIPIILLTARGDKESRLKGWYEKADEYLTKPFDVDELLIRLRNLLDIRDILKKRFSETLFTESSSIFTVPAKTLTIETTEQPADVSGAEVEKLTQEEKLNNRELMFVQKLNVVIEKSYKDSEFKMNTVAGKVNMSDRQLNRKLKAVSDMTPTEYLRRFRLDKAKQLLEEGENASYAALEVGFTSHSYFGKCFRAQFGCTPKDFVNKL